MTQDRERRAPDAPGAAVPAMVSHCGYDAGYTGGPVCQNTATVHLWAGQAPDKPSDWAMQACPEHVPQAMLIAYDWHELTPACITPGAMWQFRNHQGEGFCFWPEAVAVMHEELAKEPACATTVLPAATTTQSAAPPPRTTQSQMAQVSADARAQPVRPIANNPQGRRNNVSHRVPA